MVPLEDLAALEHLENEEDIRAAKKALKEKGGISLEAYRRMHGWASLIAEFFAQNPRVATRGFAFRFISHTPGSVS